MLLSAYNLWGGAVNEAYLRVRPLRELAGNDILASPVVSTTHAIVMLAFLLLMAGYVTVSLANRARSGRASSIVGP